MSAFQNVTSLVLRHVAKELRADRHVVLTGAVDDLILLRGEPLPLVEGLVALGQGAYDIVVVVDAAAGLRACKGEQLVGRAIEAGQASAVERGAAAALDGRAGPRCAHDPVEAASSLLLQDDTSALVIVDQADILLQEPGTHDPVDRALVATLQHHRRAVRRCRLRPIPPPGPPQPVKDPDPAPLSRICHGNFRPQAPTSADGRRDARPE